jgi:hypothetical protein
MVGPKSIFPDARQLFFVSELRFSYVGHTVISDRLSRLRATCPIFRKKKKEFFYQGLSQSIPPDAEYPPWFWFDSGTKT